MTCKKEVHLITHVETHVETTTATVHAAQKTEAVHRALLEKQLLSHLTRLTSAKVALNYPPNAPRTYQHPGAPMPPFATKRLSTQADAIAPDGSQVRILLQLTGGSMAHFQLAPGQTSIAVAHRTIEEIWYFLDGRGEMWRKLDDHAEIVPIEAGIAITIPVGAHFQFRSLGSEALTAIAITMPPWPGAGEAYPVPGPWPPTIHDTPST